MVIPVIIFSKVEVLHFILSVENYWLCLEVDMGRLSSSIQILLKIER